MACPLFVPTVPLGELVSIATPLGDLFAGGCVGLPGIAVDPETLRSCCNLGYARGRCEPAATSDADAVRVMVKSAAGNSVEVAWSVERNHHPVEVGVVRLDMTHGSTQGNLIEGLAHACASSYLRQTRRPITLRDQIARAAHP